MAYPQHSTMYGHELRTRSGPSEESLKPGAQEKHREIAGARRRKRKIWIIAGVILFLAVTVAVVIAVLVSKKVIKLGSDSNTTSGAQSGAGAGTEATSSASSSGFRASPTSTSGTATSARQTATGTTTTSVAAPTFTGCTAKDAVPANVRNTFMDPTSWADLKDFNCTFTDALVGGLPILGLNSTWSDAGRANPKVPALNEAWGSYSTRPARGVNLGGWLSLEPFITPSLFEFDASAGVVDEWTLCAHLGAAQAATTLEKHYSTFVTEKDFADMAAAGLDHVRIPFSYWAVETYDGEPYVPRMSWRYLLRAIEWARKYGIRIKLDLHGLPGSQNGWNHSGRSGDVNFLIGANGTANAQRALSVHDKLSRFFAQDRYKNVVAFYGLANEPSKSISQDAIVSWTSDAFKLVRANGVKAIVVFSDSLLPFSAWQGKLAGNGDALMLDAHNYAIFDDALIATPHAGKIALACGAWANMEAASVDPTRGFGPSMVGEWSQADTDCARHLNGVGGGSRWDGTWAAAGGAPKCPTLDAQCKCDQANADPSTYSADYKLFLKTWAIAQMDAFEKSAGWFYWTWKAENAYQWSYQAGLNGNYLPALAYQRDWDCSKPVPSLGSLPEYF